MVVRDLETLRMDMFRKRFYSFYGIILLGDGSPVVGAGSLMPFATDSVLQFLGGTLHWGPMKWAIDGGSSAAKTARDLRSGNFR